MTGVIQPAPAGARSAGARFWSEQLLTCVFIGYTATGGCLELNRAGVAMPEDASRGPLCELSSQYLSAVSRAFVAQFRWLLKFSAS
jgi:hypothetical protein